MILTIFRKSVEKIHILLKSGKKIEELCTFFIISRRIILRTRNISAKACREYQNTHFVLIIIIIIIIIIILFINFFFICAVYEVIWENIIEPGRPQMTIWCMRIACWVRKTTETHTEYLYSLLFALQECLHERASLLRYVEIA